MSTLLLVTGAFTEATIWAVSVSAEAGTSGAAEAGVLAAAESGPDWWTLAAGLIGGVVVAVVNHFFTRHREGSTWLRSEQVSTNRGFHTAALALAHLATHGLRDKPFHETAAEAHMMDRELLAKWQELLVVGEKRTVSVAAMVSELLPSLTYQTLPLPRTNHPASEKQREDSLLVIGGLMFHLEMTMREGIGLGLLARNDRKFIKCDRDTDSIQRQALSPVDRDGPKPELIGLLQDWQVLVMAGEVMPEKIEDYYNGTPFDSIAELPSGGYVLAILRKPTDGFWRLGISDGIPREVETKILEDVIRIVAGHMKAFPPLHLRNHTKVEEHEDFPGDTFIWSSNEFPNSDFTAPNTSDE